MDIKWLKTWQWSITECLNIQVKEDENTKNRMGQCILKFYQVHFCQLWLMIPKGPVWWNRTSVTEKFPGLFRFFPPQRIISPPPSRSCGCCYQCTCILFTEYIFRESVDSAHNSQISSTFQEADCSLKLVKINKQVFAITLLSRNLIHTAQLSISARGGNNNFVSRAGGGEETEKTQISNLSKTTTTFQVNLWML